MPTFIKHGYKEEDLRLLNECRMKLHAVTLADLCTVTGDRLSLPAFQGHSVDQSMRQVKWPRDPPTLSTQHWELWQSALDKCFCQLGSKEKLLHRPLGDWLIKELPDWKWFWSPSTAQLCQLQPNGRYLAHKTRRPTRASKGGALFHQTQTLTVLPEDSCPASVAKDPQGHPLLLGHSPYPLPPTLDEETLEPTTLVQARGLLSSGDKWAVQHLKSSDNGKALAAFIKEGKAIAVSDGSQDTGYATSGFTLTPRKKKWLKDCPSIKGSNSVPGNCSDLDSYRAELGGVMGIVVTLAMICRIHSITSGSLQLGLDGKSALDAVFALEDPHSEDPSADIIIDIRRKIKALPITVTGKHIKGHQDDDLSYSQLDRWGQLNVDMDTRAKDLLRKIRTKQETSPNIRFGNETLMVSFRGAKLASINKKDLYKSTYGERTQAYWAKRHSPPHITQEVPKWLSHAELLQSIPSARQTWMRRVKKHDLYDKIYGTSRSTSTNLSTWAKANPLTLAMMPYIDWEAQGKAFDKEPLGKRRWLTKHLCGQCGTGRQMLRRQEQTHDHCPRCDQPDEGTQHVVQCQEVSAKLTWNSAILDLQAWMFNSKTHIQFQDALLARLSCWQAGAPFSKVVGPKALRNAIAAQDALGWENFLYGRITPLIADYQAVHFSNIGCSNSGKVWLSKFITQLWLVIWKMWQHRNHTKQQGNTGQDIEDLKQLRLVTKQLFQQGPNKLMASDRHLLTDLYEILDYELDDLRTWVNRIRNSRDCFQRTLRRQQDRFRQSRQFMHQWRAGTVYQHANTKQAARSADS